MDNSNARQPFLARHEFLLRRLHSLSGLIPVGAFMTVHLTANASVLNSPATFQRAVYQIHLMDKVLPLVEWLFIFLPILFHALFGLAIIRGGLTNAGNYPFASNIRYTLQRATGMIAFVFIVWHVFHMHGWFHSEAWLTHVAEPLGGAQFRPFNAASTLSAAMQGFVIPVVYAIGLLSCVFHLANGIWTMGITWGLWTSPAGQRRANCVCSAAGLLLGGLSVAALVGANTIDASAAREAEDALYEAKISAHEIEPNVEKRSADRTGGGASSDGASSDGASGRDGPNQGAAGEGAAGEGATDAGRQEGPTNGEG